MNGKAVRKAADLLIALQPKSGEPALLPLVGALIDRITSYNVCYTKLLRPSTWTTCLR